VKNSSWIGCLATIGTLIVCDNFSKTQISNSQGIADLFEFLTKANSRPLSSRGKVDSINMFVTSYGLVVLLGIAAHVMVSIALARAAERKGRNFTAFFFISFFLSWAVALIIIASLPGAASATSPNGRIERPILRRKNISTGRHM
jgi:hypothetical protein